MFTATLSLDDTYKPNIVDLVLYRSDRYRKIDNLLVRHAFCNAMGEFLRDVKGMAPGGDGRKTYQYVVTDEDIDNLAKLIYHDLEVLTK